MPTAGSAARVTTFNGTAKPDLSQLSRVVKTRIANVTDSGDLSQSELEKWIRGNALRSIIDSTKNLATAMERDDWLQQEEFPSENAFLRVYRYIHRPSSDSPDGHPEQPKFREILTVDAVRMAGRSAWHTENPWYQKREALVNDLGDKAGMDLSLSVRPTFKPTESGLGELNLHSNILVVHGDTGELHVIKPIKVEIGSEDTFASLTETLPHRPTERVYDERAARFAMKISEFEKDPTKLGYARRWEPDGLVEGTYQITTSPEFVFTNWKDGLPVDDSSVKALNPSQD